MPRLCDTKSPGCREPAARCPQHQIPECAVIDDIHLKDILYDEQRPVVVWEYENLGGGPSVLMRYKGDKN